MLKPLNQFYCDTCREVIDNPEDGYFEWDDLNGKYTNFRITHNTKNCTRDSLNGRGNHLQYYMGQDGLNRLICMIHSGEIDDPKEQISSKYKSNAEFAEIFRRLHIEYYEEGRLFLRQALNDGFVTYNPLSQNEPENLKAIISHYSENT